MQFILTTHARGICTDSSSLDLFKTKLFLGGFCFVFTELLIFAQASSITFKVFGEGFMAGWISAFFPSVKQNSCEILKNTVAAVGIFLLSDDMFFPKTH